MNTNADSNYTVPIEIVTRPHPAEATPAEKAASIAYDHTCTAERLELEQWAEENGLHVPEELANSADLGEELDMVSEVCATVAPSVTREAIVELRRGRAEASDWGVQVGDTTANHLGAALLDARMCELILSNPRAFGSAAGHLAGVRRSRRGK